MRTERADEILRVAVVTLAAAAMIALLAGLAVAMRNSVETHTLGISAPPLDDEAQVALGLGHYQGACQLCHGAPGVASNLVAQFVRSFGHLRDQPIALYGLGPIPSIS